MRPRGSGLTVVFATASVLAWGLGVACSSFTEPLVSADDASVGPDSASDSGVADASVDATVCPAAGVVTPSKITVPITGAPAIVCVPESAKTLDDSGAGLGREDNVKGNATIASVEVVSCILAEFDVEIVTASVWMRAARPACNGTCGDPGDGGQNHCGAGNEARVFVGTSYATLGSYEQITGLPGAWTEYPLANFPPGIRFVAVCRGTLDKDKNDVEVDAILGGCN